MKCVLRWVLVVSKRDKMSWEYFCHLGLNTQSQLLSYRNSSPLSIKKIFGQFYQSFVCKTQMFLQVLLDSIVVYLSSLIVLDEQIDIIDFAS